MMWFLEFTETNYNIYNLKHTLSQLLPYIGTI